MLPSLQSDVAPPQARVLVNRTQAAFQPFGPLSQTPLSSEQTSSFIKTLLNALLQIFQWFVIALKIKFRFYIVGQILVSSPETLIRQI